MDMHQKWKPEEIAHAKNLMRALKKMLCGPDMLGIEAYHMGMAMQWFDNVLLVMQAPPPVKAEQVWGKEHKPPMRETHASKKQTEGGKKTRKSTKGGSGSKIRSKTNTKR